MDPSVPLPVSTRIKLAYRLGALTLCALLILAIAWAFLLRPRRPGNSVHAVDRTEEFRDMLEERAGSGPAPAAPPILRAGVPWPGLVLNPADKAALLGRGGWVERKYKVLDPHAYCRLAPGQVRERRFGEHPRGGWVMHTNSLGLRGAEELLDEPDLRVLVTGDSHVQGVCADEETWPALLGQRLRAARPGEDLESLNAAVGGYGPYHYLGVLECFLHLQPDLFVVTVFGGNDFKYAQTLQRYYAHRGPYETGPHDSRTLAEKGIEHGGLRPQELEQILYFLNNPDEVRVAIETMVALTDTMQRLCEAEGIRLVFVYLPPPLTGQPQHFGELSERVAEALAVEREELRSSDRIADGWMEFLAERAIPCVDLRPPFRASQVPWFWNTDLHLNLAGQRAVAEAVAPVVQGLVEPR